MWAQGSVAAPVPEQAVCLARRDSRHAALHLADAAPALDEVPSALVAWLGFNEGMHTPMHWGCALQSKQGKDSDLLELES